MYLLYNYLYGFAEVNMNRSPNPFSSLGFFAFLPKPYKKVVVVLRWRCKLN